MTPLLETQVQERKNKLTWRTS